MTSPEAVRALLRDPGAGPPPGPDLLARLGDELTEDDALRYLRVIRHHPGFDPPPSWSDVIAHEVDALLRLGTDRVADQVADDLRTDFDPVGATRSALRRIGLRGAFDAAEADAVERLVRRLVADPALAPVVAESVADWDSYDSAFPLHDRVRALLP